MSTNKNLITLKPLTDETTFPYHQYVVDDETRFVSDNFYTPKRTIPNSVKCKWYIHHQPPANPFDDDPLNRHVKMTVHFTKFVRKGTITIEVKDPYQISTIPKQTHKFEKPCKSFQWHYMMFYDMMTEVSLMPHHRLELRWTIEVETEAWFIPELPMQYGRFDFEEDTDFKIVCGTEEVKVHKEVLRKISQVFSNVLSNNVDEINSGKFKIDDFDVKTVQTVFDCVYNRHNKILNHQLSPVKCDLPVELVVKMLYFADKYGITGIFDQFEQVPMYNLSTTNFCVVLRYADDSMKKALFSKCALYYKRNYENIKTTDTFTSLPGQLKIKLLQTAFKLATVFDVIEHAHQNGIGIGLEQIKLPLVTTLDDFFKCIPGPYAGKIFTGG